MQQSIQQLAPGTVFARDFRIERTLGVGGMGAVYEAEHLTDGQRVALKLMHPSQIADPKLRKRFAQEARVGAWIGSPHIVEVVRAGVDDTGVPWLAMELLQGQTLASRIQRFLPAQGLPHDEAWLVLSQLCRGLIAAHDKGVVHRDLKPENVFITTAARSDAPFTVKILDFGIAKRIDRKAPELNRTTAIGTPLWMAPEQNEVTEITPAADVWAIALVCFRMFTGRYYWMSANERELNLGWLYHELVTDALLPARERAELLGCELLVPKGFDDFFTRCIVRDPKQRFASAREMAEALVKIAPPYFKPFDASATLPPGVASTPLPGTSPELVQAVSAPTLAMVAPLPSPMPASSPAPAPAPMMAPVVAAVVSSAPTTPPPRASKSRVMIVIAAVVVCALLAYGAWLMAGSRGAETSGSGAPRAVSPVADSAQARGPAPPVQTTPGIVPSEPRVEPGIVPTEPSLPQMPVGPAPVAPPPRGGK